MCWRSILVLAVGSSLFAEQGVLTVRVKDIHKRAVSALQLNEKAGPDHPETAISLNNLADLLESKGDYVGAKPLYRRAVAMMEKPLGPDHPRLKRCARILTQFWRSAENN